MAGVGERSLQRAVALHSLGREVPGAEGPKSPFGKYHSPSGIAGWQQQAQDTQALGISSPPDEFIKNPGEAPASSLACSMALVIWGTPL